MQWIVQKYLRVQLPIAMCLYLSHILVGYSLGWTAIVVVKMQDIQQSPLNYTLSVEESSWFGTSSFVGLIFVPQITSLISIYVGRKPCIIGGSVIMLACNLILTFATTFAMIIIGRIIVGAAVGILMVMNTVYIGEIASANIRGILLSLCGVFFTFGTFMVYTVGPFVTYQALGYVTLPFCILHLFGCIFIPESPLVYIIKGDEAAAKTSLEELGRDKDIDKDLKSMVEIKNELKNSTGSWKKLFTVKSNRRALIINVVLYSLQNGNGMVYVLFFVTSIFHEAGSSVEPAVATIIIGATNVLSTLIVPLFIERIGRRVLLLWSIAGCFVATTVMGVYFYLDVEMKELINNVRWIPLAALIFLSICFCFGLNIIPNTVSGEMFKPRFRSVGTAMSASVGWLAACLSIMLSAYLTALLGNYGIFGICAVINLCGFVFTALLLPETKGLTLSEIDEMMEN